MKRILILLTSLSLIAGFAAVTPAPAKAVNDGSTFSGPIDLVVSQFGVTPDYGTSEDPGTATYDGAGDCESPDFNTIQEAVEYAEWDFAASTVIQICNGFYYEEIDSTIGLTLVGENRYKTILDGSLNSDSTVELYDGPSEMDLTVFDITFRNGDNNSNDGGAVWVSDDFYCYNSTFVDNYADGDGGAIYSDGGVAEVHDCLFDDNYADDYGGAIYANYFTSDDSSFIDNYAEESGGAVYVYDGFGDLNSSLFEGNYAEGAGGAIVSYGYGLTDSMIYRSTFKNNTAEYGDGGAICIYDNNGDLAINLAASSFIGNRNDLESYGYEGGAIYLSPDDDDDYLTTSTVGRAQTIFQGNQSGYNGGAISWDGDSYADLSLISARFLDNTAEDGGAVHAHGDLFVTGSVFTGNRAEYEGGAIDVDEDAVIRNSTFTRNVAVDNDGGAINSDDGDLTVTSSTFTSNSADDGGAISMDDSDDLTVEGSTFVGNRAEGDLESDYDDGAGGAIYIYDDGDAYISRSTFRNNSASEEGGAIASEDNYDLFVVSSTFMNNSAEEAGAILFEADDLELRGNLFQGNRAFGVDDTPSMIWAAGAVALDYADSWIIRGNRFISNSGWGVGALYIEGGCVAGIFNQAAMRSNTWRSNRVVGGEPQTYRDVRVVDTGCGD